MAIKIDCPRCKKPLSVPRKRAGGYVNCPECSGRFWVPNEAPADAPRGGTFAASSGTTVAHPPQAPPPPGSGPSTVSMRGTPSISSPQTAPISVSPAAPPNTPLANSPLAVTPPLSPPGPIPTPPAPAQGRKAARFISAEAAQSKLEIAEDGQLPDLHLQEGDKKQKSRQRSTTVNPLVLFGIIAISVVISISLALYDTDPDQTSSARTKAHARRQIEEQYFGEIGSQQPLKPYQIYLREAQRAHTQRDFKRERELYRRVLELLRAERPREARGLTGSRQRDKDLQQYISVLLGPR